MAVVINGVTKTFTVTSQTLINVRKDLFSLWVHWVKESDNAKYLQAMRPVGGDGIGGESEAPNFFFLMNNWKVVVDGVVVTFQFNLYCEKETNDNYVPFLYLNGGHSNNEVSSSPVVKIATGSVLTTQQNDKLMAIPTATENATATLDLDVECP